MRASTRISTRMKRVQAHSSPPREHAPPAQLVCWRFSWYPLRRSGTSRAWWQRGCQENCNNTVSRVGHVYRGARRVLHTTSFSRMGSAAPYMELAIEVAILVPSNIQTTASTASARLNQLPRCVHARSTLRGEEHVNQKHPVFSLKALRS